MGTGSAMWRWLLKGLSRISDIEPLLLLVLTVITAALWGFVEIADEVFEGDTDALDRRVISAMREPGNSAEPVGPAWMEEMGRDATALGGIAWLTFSIVIVAVFLWLNDKRHMMLLMLGATTGGAVVCGVLKNFFGRPRPDVVPHLAHVSSSSFPSGHSMLSAVVYLTLGSLLAAVMPNLKLKIYILGVGIALSIIVGLSRIYLGVHYPTDVLAGWLAGLVWALLCWLAARWLQHRGKVEKEPV